MNKLTYKQFKSLIELVGFECVRYNGRIYVEEKGHLMAYVDEEVLGVASTDFSHFAELSEELQIFIAQATHKLSLTPIRDREEPKKYYLKVKPRYNHLFAFGARYLNYRRENADMFMSYRGEDEYWQTQFTEEECDLLEKEYDLTILERVEVEED